MGCQIRVTKEFDGIKVRIPDDGYWYATNKENANILADGLFEIMNKNTGTEQHRHHVVEVSMYNLLSIFEEGPLIICGNHANQFVDAMVFWLLM